MLTPEQFKSACGSLLGIVNSQTTISTKADLGDKSALSILNDAGRQLNEDTLSVLVMGKFSSGKSTFLNALMGQTFLPAKPTPTTAVIGEIVYADAPEAVLYPKKGYSGGEKPFNIKVDELGKYIVIDHSTASGDEAKKPNPFKKIVIKYPLNVCKHGIMFVDSPGLDDPTCHDAITKDYLPNADAIVYCMNSSQAFSAADKSEIERLIALGYRSIIFVLTYFDVLQGNDDIMGTNGAEDARKHYTQILSKYTDLGTAGIFFVGSVPALKAKKTGNQQLLEASNFPPLEKKLEEILFNEKGRMKLLKALYSTRKVNRDTAQHLTDKIDIARADKNGLAERIHIAQNNLNQARTKANEIETQFRIGTQNLVAGAKDRGRAFFLSSILPNINTWVNDFTPSEEQVISMWHPKRTITAFTEGCIKHVQGCIEASLSIWCEQDLVPKYIMPQFDALTMQQDANLKAFENDLKDVRANLHLSLDGDSISDGEQAGAGNRILSAIAGVVVGGPGGAVVGGMLGWKGLIPALISQIVAGIVLGVISCFTPVGFPVVVITAVLAAFVGAGFGINNIESKIRKKIADEMREKLAAEQESVANSIGDSVSTVIGKVQKAVSDSLYAPVSQYEKILSEAQHAVTAESSILQKRVAEYTQLRSENAKLANDIDLFAQNLN